MSKKIIFSLALLFGSMLCASPSMAHFGMLIPSEAMIMDQKNADIRLDIAFAHPFGQNGMAMEKPAEFFVFAAGGRTDLLPGLRERKYLGKEAWQGAFKIARPGVYQFAFVPRPYWEPAEDCFIVHYTKTVVAAFGEEDGWNLPIGLPVEIVPLTRPFGNYAGNVFSGVVLRDGRPQPNVPVEVENLNRAGAHAAPNPYFETQVVRTDANGVFTFGIPWAGWWGFAALCESDRKIELNGQQKDVETGGVIWVRFTDPVAGRK